MENLLGTDYISFLLDHISLWVLVVSFQLLKVLWFCDC